MPFFLTQTLSSFLSGHKSVQNTVWISLFLNEIENTTDHNSSFYGTKGHYAMVNDHIDLFLAGMETTSTSLNWTFLYLLHHPEIKCKIHDELNKVDCHFDMKHLHEICRNLILFYFFEACEITDSIEKSKVKWFWNLTFLK